MKKRLACTSLALLLALSALILLAGGRGQPPAGPRASNSCGACGEPIGAGAAGGEQAGAPNRSEVEELLRRLRACKPVELGEGQALTLVYSVLGDTLVEYSDGSMDVLAMNGSASLIVHVTRVGGGYVVRFRLVVDGEALTPRNWSRVRVAFAREVELLYDPERGYSLPNGTELGQFFPLFARPERLVLRVMWARLGEPYRLAGMRAAVASLGGYGVLDVRSGVGVSFHPNGTLKEVVRLEGRALEVAAREAVRRLGCGDLLGGARYSSDDFPFMVVVDYVRGIPLLLHARGALRSLPTTVYVWQGQRLEEAPALPIAELLGVRDSFTLRLVDVGRG